MTPVNFAYWLQGFFEIVENSETKDINLTPKQVEVIRAHLNLVFFHVIDPENLKGKTLVEKDAYQKIHDGAKSGEIVKSEAIQVKDLPKNPFEPFPKATLDETSHKHSWIPDYEIRYNC